MKKLLVVLLSLGLFAAFSIPAFAVDVKISGEYRIRGWYDNNPSMLDKNTAITGVKQSSVAFFDQRLRVQTELQIAEGLTLTTRFDALEKKWGDTTAGTGTYNNAGLGPGPAFGGVAGGDSEGRSVTASSLQQENIEFERAYLTFRTPIGLWMVGYQNFSTWGPDTGNSSITRPGIKYIVPIGNLMIVAAIEKGLETSVGTNLGTWSDADANIYDLGAIYKFKGGDAGIMFQHVENSSTRTLPAVPTVTGPYKLQFTVANPYVRATSGPVFFEAEAAYYWGSAKMDQTVTGVPDQDVEEFAFFGHARVNLAPIYLGGYFGFATGDDPNTKDKSEGGWLKTTKAGRDFMPCLMLFNDDYATQFAGAKGVASLGSYMDNMYFYQVYVGAKPTDKLDIKASYTYATAEKAPKGYVSKKFGQEIDLTASYKIYDNLSYMIGTAYFITGDYFKGTDSATKIDNDYLLLNKLTLSF